MPRPSSSTERLRPATHALRESAYFAPAPSSPSAPSSSSKSPSFLASDYAYDLQAPHRDNISVTSRAVRRARRAGSSGSDDG
ncbi:hypothetical protein FB451DRAFT_1393815 [Mycena latifolia]|nr:hypothetical protein FB451DRAFT_1393815 [Mycena latifolia]